MIRGCMRCNHDQAGIQYDESTVRLSTAAAHRFARYRRRYCCCSGATADMAFPFPYPSFEPQMRG
jgi:hypothetical protein